MHDYEDDDQFDVYDWCDGDIDIPELNEAIEAEPRREANPNLLRRLQYNAGPADAPETFKLSLPTTVHESPLGEDVTASSPRAGSGPLSELRAVDGNTRLAAIANIARAWQDDSRSQLWPASLEKGAGHGPTEDSGDDFVAHEQMTTIVVQVKHAPLTAQSLACGAASALTARIDSIPIVTAVRKALESLYGSIGHPPPTTGVNPLCFTHDTDELLTQPGGEPESPSGNPAQPPGAPKAEPASLADDARTPTSLFTSNPKADPTLELDATPTPNNLHPDSSVSKIAWKYPVSDVDVIVALQQPPNTIHRDPGPDDTSTEALERLRRQIRDLGLAVDGFPRTHRSATSEVYAADPNAGGEPLVVVTSGQYTEQP